MCSKSEVQYGSPGKVFKEFSDRHGLAFTRISYEELFEGNGIAIIETELGTKLNRSSADAANKLLPDPKEWLENYDDLREIALVLYPRPRSSLYLARR